VPGDHDRAALRRGGAQLDELLVVDEDARLLALADLGDLWPRERRVEQQHCRAELRCGDARFDEVGVIAAEDRDPIALADAHGAQAVRERVGLLVQFAEGDGAAVVMDRRSLRVAHRGDRVARGRRRSPALEQQQGADRVVGALDPQHARARQREAGVERRQCAPERSHAAYPNTRPGCERKDLGMARRPCRPRL